MHSSSSSNNNGDDNMSYYILKEDGVAFKTKKALKKYVGNSTLSETVEYDALPKDVLSEEVQKDTYLIKEDLERLKFPKLKRLKNKGPGDVERITLPSHEDEEYDWMKVRDKLISKDDLGLVQKMGKKLISVLRGGSDKEELSQKEEEAYRKMLKFQKKLQQFFRRKKEYYKENGREQEAKNINPKQESYKAVVDILKGDLRGGNWRWGADGEMLSFAAKQKGQDRDQNMRSVARHESQHATFAEIREEYGEPFLRKMFYSMRDIVEENAPNAFLLLKTYLHKVGYDVSNPIIAEEYVAKLFDILDTQEVRKEFFDVVSDYTPLNKQLKRSLLDELKKAKQALYKFARNLTPEQYNSDN